MRNRTTKRRVFERYLTAPEEKQLLRHIGQFSCPLAQRDRAWILLLRHTGIRVGTLALLTVGDAKDMLAAGNVIVPDEYAKGGRGYELPLNKAAAAALRKLLEIRREQDKKAPGLSSPLLLSRKRTPLSVRSLQARMTHWVRDAKLPVAATPHWLRHTLAKRLMQSSEARDPQAIVQVVLGHQERRTTEVYTLPDREEIAAALENAR